MKLSPQRQIQADFVKQLGLELKEFEEFLRKYEPDEPILVQVAKKACEWKADPEKELWFFCMFSRHANSPVHFNVGFLGSLHSFLINSCLDDCGFRIKWVSYKFNRRGELVPFETSREDPLAFPEVVRDNNGLQDPALLLEAMEERERRELARIKWNEEQAGLFR